MKRKKMMSKSIREISEQIQEDLIVLLESQFGEVEYLEDVKDMACQIVVDHMKEFEENHGIYRLR
jgi:hypothetical protein